MFLHLIEENPKQPILCTFSRKGMFSGYMANISQVFLTVLPAY